MRKKSEEERAKREEEGYGRLNETNFGFGLVRKLLHEKTVIRMGTSRTTKFVHTNNLLIRCSFRIMYIFEILRREYQVLVKDNV